MSRLAVVPEMFGQRPPAAPIIEVDASLVSAPEELAFDFDAFYDMGRSAGLSNEHIRAYSTIYEDKKRSYNGRYLPKHQAAFVSVPTCRGTERAAAKMGTEVFKAKWEKSIGHEVSTDLRGIINEVTIHEFGHYIDHQTGHLKRNNILRNIPGLLLGSEVVVGPFLPILAEMADMNGIKTALGVVVGTIVTAGAVIVQHRLPLDMDPVEGPAYRFQGLHSDTTVVNFSPNI